MEEFHRELYISHSQKARSLNRRSASIWPITRANSKKEYAERLDRGKEAGDDASNRVDLIKDAGDMVQWRNWQACILNVSTSECQCEAVKQRLFNSTTAKVRSNLLLDMSFPCEKAWAFHRPSHPLLISCDSIWILTHNL